MSTFLRLGADRSPVDRMKRGVNAGFLTSVLLAVVVAITSVVAADGLETDHDRVTLLEAQRIDLLEVQFGTAALSSAAGRDASEDRLELRRAIDRIEAREVDLLIEDPGIGSVMLDVDGESVLFADAFHGALDAVESAVRFSTSDVNEAVIGNAVSVALDRVDVVADALGARAAEARDGVSNTAQWVRLGGLIVALAAFAMGFVRMIVLGRPLVDRMIRDHESFVTAEQQHIEEGMRRDLTARITEGLEAAESEAGVLDVVERSLLQVVPDQPAELLLADSSKAHLRAVASNENHEAPGCGVTSPWSCPAVRRASTVTYEDSSSLRACPHLADRGELSAVCVPVSFMGDAMGVLHVTGDVGWSPEALRLDALEIVAGQAAVRLGSIRSFLKAEIQASTDVLTGLPNRRATEDRIGTSLASRDRASIALADLDRFKLLNDTHGHEAGDRALRLFAEVLRESIREEDWAGRWGGEEFVLHLPGLSAREAAEVLDRIRTSLAEACGRTDGPDVTVSIGVVDTAAAQTLDELVSLADDCLYFAKENGRDQVVVGPVRSDTPNADLETTS